MLGVVRSWLFITSLSLLLVGWWGYACWQNRPAQDEEEPLAHQLSACWGDFSLGLILWGPPALFCLLMTAVAIMRERRARRRLARKEAQSVKAREGR